MDSFAPKYDSENISTREGDVEMDVKCEINIILKIEKTEYGKWFENDEDTNSFRGFQFNCFVDLHRGLNQEEISRCKHCRKTFYSMKQNKFISSGAVNQETESSMHSKYNTPQNIFRNKVIVHDGVDAKENKRRSVRNKDVKIKYSNRDEFMTDNLKNEAEKFQCLKCDKSFKFKSVFKSHVSAVHSKEKKFRCVLCTKPFSTINNLKSHERIHTGEKPYECYKCHQSFRVSGQLDYHLLNSHFKEIKFACSSCNKSFCSRGNLKVHERAVHTNEKPYECNICKKKYKHSNKLKQHSSDVHLQIKKFACMWCRNSFSAAKNLIAHQELHTDEKLFECDNKCFKKFGYPNQLKDHSLKVPFKKNRFTCTWCCKAFSSRGNLRSHMMTHTLEKPFSCDQCGRSFSQKAHLNCHLRIHNNEKPYQCHKCFKRFTQLSNLKKHLPNCT